jgi:arsenate reductase-like glutaredoxin family protein/menaquinone-dependent protoporphyrinogen IX oxidase
MKKVLVAYFSPTGHTKKAAAEIAETIDADIYEIMPAVPYTAADLQWSDPKARSTVEMNDRSFRPALADQDANIGQYDIIFLGFPIWWYVAPTIVNTFLENHDLRGKKLAFFATSGTSGMGDTVKELAPSCPFSEILGAKRFAADAGAEELAAWHAKSGLPARRFFNTSGKLYRELRIKEQLDAGMTEDEMFALLSTNGMMVKRPIVVGDGFVLVGFKEADWAARLLG